MGVHDSVVKIITTDSGAGATIGTPADAVAHGTTDGTVIAKLKSVADYSQTLGTPSEAATSVGGTGSLSAKLRLGTTLWDAIKTAVEAVSTATGATGDAAASAGGTGSLSAKLRNVTSLLNSIKTAVEGTLTVSGTVTVNEPVSIDDNGASITIDNADVTAAATVLGATGDAAATAGSTGTLSAKARLLTTLSNAISAVLGTTSDATQDSAGSGTLSSRIRHISQTIGTTADPSGTGPGNSLVGRVDNVGAVIGAIDAAASVVGGTGTLSGKARLLTTLTDAIKTAVEALHSTTLNPQENSWWSFDAIEWPETFPGLLTDSVSNFKLADAIPVTTAALGYDDIAGNGIAIFIPVTDSVRNVLSVTHTFDVTVSYEVSGVLYVEDTAETSSVYNQRIYPLVAISNIGAGVFTVTGDNLTALSVNNYYPVAINAGWTHIAIKVLMGGVPTSGQLSLLVTRCRTGK